MPQTWRAQVPSEWLGLLELSGGAFRVYFALAHHADRHTGTAFPTYERIIELTGLSRDTISRALRDLASAGAIRVHPAAGKHHTTGGFRHNKYTVNLRSDGPWHPQVIEKRKRRSTPARRPAETGAAAVATDMAAEVPHQRGDVQPAAGHPPVAIPAYPAPVAHPSAVSDAHPSAVSDAHLSVVSDTSSPNAAETRVRDLGDKQSYGNTPTVHSTDQPTPAAGLRKRSPATQGRKGEPCEFTRLIRVLEDADTDDLRDPARTRALAVWVQRPDWRYGLKLCVLRALRYTATNGGRAIAVFCTALKDGEHQVEDPGELVDPLEAWSGQIGAWDRYLATVSAGTLGRTDLYRLFSNPPPQEDLPVICNADVRNRLVAIAAYHGVVRHSEYAA